MSGTHAPHADAADGFLARRDDRARLLAFFAVAAPLSLVAAPEALEVGAALGLLAATTCGLGPRQVLRRLAPVAALVVPVLLFTPFWGPAAARPIFQGWPGGPTSEGTALALTIAVRALALSLLAIGAFAAPLPRTLEGARRLGAPAPLVHAALLTVRFVERLQDDLGRARVALGLRGFRPRPDASTVATWSGVTAALLVRSVARTERVETAMRLRGYAGRLVLPPRGPAGPADALLLLAAVAAGAGLVALDRGAS